MSKIVLFSDLHYGEDIKNKAGKLGVNTHGHTNKILYEFNKKIGDILPEVVINLGDLVYGNTIEQKYNRYNKIMGILSHAQGKIYHLIGNHELYITDKNDIANMTAQNICLAFDSGGYRHIITDIDKNSSTKSNMINRTWEMPNITFKWLERELQKSEIPCIVYGHCPITEHQDNLTYYHRNNPSKAFLDNSQEIRKLLEKYSARMYVSGHTHFEYNSIINGIQYITIPSFSEDIDGKPSGRYAVLDTQKEEIIFCQI